jgi:hypothetical protein
MLKQHEVKKVEESRFTLLPPPPDPPKPKVDVDNPERPLGPVIGRRSFQRVDSPSTLPGKAMRSKKKPYSFIYSFNKHFLSAYHVPGSALDITNIRPRIKPSLTPTMVVPTLQ